MQKINDIKTLVFVQSFDVLETAVSYASALQRFSPYDFAVYPVETRHGHMVYHVYRIKPFNTCRS